MTIGLPPPTQRAMETDTGKWTEPWYRFISRLNESGANNRRVLTEGTTFHVNGSTGSASGDGGDTTPFSHPQEAYDYIAENIDGDGNYVKILLANGTYEMRTTANTNSDTGSQDAVLCMDRDLVGVSAIIVEGESEGGVIFNGFGVLHNASGFVRYRNITFSSVALENNRGIFNRAPGATIGILDGCTFGPFLDTDASTCGIQYFSPGNIKIFSPITIAGGMHRFIFLEASSTLDWENLSGAPDPWITFVGTPAIPFFIQLGPMSSATMINLVFAGSFTGTKYVNQGGNIGIFPFEHPNDLIPGTIDGQEAGWGNINIDNNTGTLPAFDVGFQLRFGGVSSGTFNVIEANYIEYGPAVTGTVTFNLSSKGAQTGSATLGPLPFTSGDFGAVLGWTGAVDVSNMNAPVGGWGNIIANIGPTSDYIELRYLPSAGGSTVPVTDVEFNNNSSVQLTFTYFRSP